MANLMWRIAIWILITIEFGVDANPSGMVITLPQGRIKGRYSETRTKRMFIEFHGIPYAQVQYPKIVVKGIVKLYNYY